MTPAAIHSSRRRRNVVAEQRRSPWRRYPAPKTRTLISSSKTIRSEIRGRWQPNGCRSWRSGKRAANCSQMGSIRHDGKAGQARLLAHSLSLRFEPWLCGLFDGWMAGSSLSAGSFWGVLGRGFGILEDWLGAQCWLKSAKPSPDEGGGESAGFVSSFPWEAEVVNEVACEAELGVGGEDEPGPAVGLFGVAQRWGGPAQGVLEEPEGVLDVEAAQVSPPTDVEVEGGSRGPEPQRLLGPAGGFGQGLDVDPDHGAGHDRQFVVVVPVSAVAEFGVQTVPGADLDGAVADIGGGRLDVGGGPGVGVSEAEPVAVAAGSPYRACGRWFGVGVEDPVVANPDHDACGHIGEFVGECDRVVTGVEAEHRRLA